MNRMTEKFIAARNYVRRNEQALRKKYQGRYIAVLNGEVIDSDENVMNLWKRVCEKPIREKDLNKVPITGSVNSILSDSRVLEEILSGGIV